MEDIVKIPAYIKELMERSYYYYDFDPHDARCAAGYTIAVAKRTAYTKVETLKREVERLKKWVERQQGGECHIIYCPTRTHYISSQYAFVTIFDPVMKHIESYIHP